MFKICLVPTSFLWFFFLLPHILLVFVFIFLFPFFCLIFLVPNKFLSFPFFLSAVFLSPCHFLCIFPCRLGTWFCVLFLLSIFFSFLRLSHSSFPSIYFSSLPFWSHASLFSLTHHLTSFSCSNLCLSPVPYFSHVPFSYLLFIEFFSLSLCSYPSLFSVTYFITLAIEHSPPCSILYLLILLP